jgi:hypothetical protein
VGAALLLLNTETASFKGCELFPGLAVAVPVAGKLSVPRTVRRC